MNAILVTVSLPLVSACICRVFWWAITWVGGFKARNSCEDDKMRKMWGKSIYLVLIWFLTHQTIGCFSAFGG